MASSTPTVAQHLVIMTTEEDGNLFDTCDDVLSENNITKRQKLLLFGDSTSDKYETLKTISELTDHQSSDKDVIVLNANLDASGGDFIPVCRIVQYDDNCNILNIRVKQKTNSSNEDDYRWIRTITGDIREYLYLLLIILTVGLQSRLGIYSLVVLSMVLYEQYRGNKCLIDTVNTIQFAISLQAIRLFDSQQPLLGVLICLILVVAPLLFCMGLEQRLRGGSLGYTIGLCLIVFPLTATPQNYQDTICIYSGTLFCILFAFLKEFMKREKSQFKHSYKIILSVTVLMLLIVCQHISASRPSMCSAARLSIIVIIITNLISTNSYALGVKYSPVGMVHEYAERKTPNLTIIAMFYIYYGYVFMFASKVDILWNSSHLFVYFSVGAIFIIHVYYFYEKGETRMYTKFNYSTMPASEFLGCKLSLWEFDSGVPVDSVPNNSVCLLFFNTAEAVRDPVSELKRLNNWLNAILMKSRRRNIPVFCVGTHSRSFFKRDLEKFAISVAASLDLRFNNMVIKNNDGLPVFYVENEEKNNQGLEILKRKILKEVKK